MTVVHSNLHMQKLPQQVQLHDYCCSRNRLDYSSIRLSLAHVRIQVVITLMLTTTVLTITMAYTVVSVLFDVEGEDSRSEAGI